MLLKFNNFFLGEKYGSIKKHMLHGRTSTNIGLLNTPKRPLPPLSYINYYFDFEPAINRAQSAKTNNRTGMTKFGPAVSPPKLVPLDWDQELEVLRPISSSAINSQQQQRGIAFQQDVEFYSIAFDLNLETVK